MTKKKMSFCCLLFLVFLVFAGITEAKVKVSNHTYGSSNIKYIQIKGAKYKSLNQKMKALAKKTRENEKALKAKFKKNSDEWKKAKITLTPKVTMDSGNLLSIKYHVVPSNPKGKSNSKTYGFTAYKGKVYRLNAILKNATVKKILEKDFNSYSPEVKLQPTKREYYLKKGSVYLIIQGNERTDGKDKDLRFDNIFTKYVPEIQTIPKKFQGKWYAYIKNKKPFYHVTEYSKNLVKQYFVDTKGKKLTSKELDKRFETKGYSASSTDFMHLKLQTESQGSVTYWSHINSVGWKVWSFCRFNTTSYQGKQVQMLSLPQVMPRSDWSDIYFRKMIPIIKYGSTLKNGDGGYISWSKLKNKK